jgi:predicted N-formylglutamate amidohydrolase
VHESGVEYAMHDAAASAPDIDYDKPEAEPYIEVINPEAAGPWLITVDHASNAVPAALRGLGLSAKDLSRHIGWDIGAGALARRLAQALNVTAVLAVVSRLVVDANRPLGDPDCMPRSSDGTLIPGNADLSEGEMRARAKAYYWPYHRCIDEHIARLRMRGHEPAVVAIHSFTPALNTKGDARPWHVGVMFSHDERLGRKLIAALGTDPALVVGENQPYSGFRHGYAQKLHGLAQMLPHAQIEVRQDLIADAAGQAVWATRLAKALEASKNT